MKRCTNAEPGTYGHECGQPAQWTATKPNGYSSAFIDGDKWEAGYTTPEETGPTPLIAAMRCHVASKLGDTVEIPDELC